MKHVIATKLGKVKILPVFDDEHPTAYKCYLLGENVIVRVRDLHRLEEKLKQRIDDKRVQSCEKDKRLFFRYR